MTRPTIAICLTVGVVAVVGAAFLRPEAHRTPAPAAAVAMPAETSTSVTTTIAVPASTSTTTTTIDPGSLPQTRDKPSATDPLFVARMQLLVQAVSSGNTAIALPAFFPLSAYQQVKAVANPTADWKYRLVALFDQDIAGLHRTLGSSASSMTFSGVDVPDSAARWIVPGVEYNRIGYWRVYNTRVRYSAGGQNGSFIVISLISWRGQWYVVHFRTQPK